MKAFFVFLLIGLILTQPILAQNGGPSPLLLLGAGPSLNSSGITMSVSASNSASSGYQAAQSTYSFSVDCEGANRYLYVGVTLLSVAGTTVTGVTHNGVALTSLGSKGSVSGAVRVEAWRLIAPATGSLTVAVTLSASIASAAGATCLTGVNQTSPEEGLASASATNVGAADATVNVVTTSAGDFVIDTVGADDTAINPGYLMWPHWNTTGATGSGGNATRPTFATGTQADSWTNVAALATWSIIAVGVAPVNVTAVTGANAAVVQATACTSGTGSGNTACTIPSTGAGNLLAVWEFDYQTTNNGSVPTNAGGGTWTQSCTWATSIRTSVYTLPNTVSGITSITVRPNTGRSTAVIYEISGMATSSVVDACVTNLISASGAAQRSDPVTSAQSDVALGATFTANTSTPAQVATDNWVSTVDSPNTPGTGDAFSGVILNGSGQFVWRTTNGSGGSTFRNYIALFKTSVVGTPPTGFLNTTVIDFENSTNGTQVAVAIANAGSHGGCFVWSKVGTGTHFLVATSGQKDFTQNNTANGVTFNAASGGSRGWSYDMQDSGTSFQCTVPTSVASVCVGGWIKTGTNEGGGAVLSAVSLVNTSNLDYAILNHTQGYFIVEVKSSTTPAQVAVSANTWYKYALHYVAGGTHSVTIFDSTGALVGTSTDVSTGVNNMSNLQIGNNHAGTGTTGNLIYFDGVVMDYTGGTCPLP